jgi:hypothetical protein
MPKVDQQNTTSATKRSAPQATQAHEAVAGATVSAHGWRHPAERALTEIAEDWGGGIEVTASLDGDLDIIMGTWRRIEVRDHSVNIVPIDPEPAGADAPGTIRLSYDGLDVLVRLLGAIQAWAAAEDAALPAAA